MPRKPFKHYRTDNKHPTRTNPETNAIPSKAITLFKNMGRTLYMDGSGKTMEQCVEILLSVMPWFRNHCQTRRPAWTTHQKYRKGLIDLIATTNRTMAKYLPEADRSKLTAERRAGINLTRQLIGDGWCRSIKEEEVEELVNEEMKRIKKQGDSSL